MKYQLQIKEEAIEDIKIAYTYYEQQCLGLGERFLETIETYLIRVEKYPEHYQIKKKTFREAYVKTFPFVIIFEISNSLIIVYAIFNTSRNSTNKPI